jgi:hypothetical protein
MYWDLPPPYPASARGGNDARRWASRRLALPVGGRYNAFLFSVLVWPPPYPAPAGGGNDSRRWASRRLALPVGGDTTLSCFLPLYRPHPTPPPLGAGMTLAVGRWFQGAIPRFSVFCPCIAPPYPALAGLCITLMSRCVRSGCKRSPWRRLPACV